MNYTKTLFEKGNKVFKANEVEIGNIIALKNNKFFYVDDFDKFFINDKVAKLYADDEEPSTEHTKITFYDENENTIENVPGEALCICFKRADGNYNL